MKDLRLAANMPHKGFVLDGLDITGIDDAEEYILFGKAVEVFFDGGSFICGRDQEFKVGQRWVKAKNLLRKQLGERVVYKVKDVGVKELHDYSVEGTHSFEVCINNNKFIAHNLHSLGNLGGGGSGGAASSRWYKYMPVEKTVISTRTVRKKKKVEKTNIDIARLVLLGGTFEQIGDEDESIGGGDQKVGTANQ